MMGVDELGCRCGVEGGGGGGGGGVEGFLVGMGWVVGGIG